MALKTVVAKRVLDDILGSVYREGQWKVLVLDQLSTRIVSACCKMQDVMSKGITLVESLEKPRQPFPHLEAVYIIVPTDSTIQTLMDDFDRDPLYRVAHVFFLEKCSQSLFSKLGSSKAAKRIGTLQEANMAFLPYESKVFTLDYPQAFGDFYTQGSMVNSEMVNRIADQLATVCAMMGENPAVRYRNDVSHLVELAQAVQSRLDTYKAENRSLGSGPEKHKSQLIIVDRGFDVVSPILHELTFQAMVYDLLPIKNDVFSYRTITGGGDSRLREVILAETDEVWSELRHRHIAEVSKEVYEKFQSFATEKKLKHAKDPDISIKDLARHIKKVPQYQKELSRYSLHINLAEECLAKFRGGINSLCKVEQDLALGTDAQGDPITEPLRNMMPCLFDRKLSSYDKVRLLILYILHKKGVSQDDLQKLIQHSEIPQTDRKCILNVARLGYTMLTEEAVKAPKYKLKQKDRPGEKYEVSRWTPLVQDLAEYAVADSLDEGYCPYLRSKPRPSSGMTSWGTSAATGGAQALGITGTSVRQRWGWIPSQRAEAKEAQAQKIKKDGPVVIIFVVGGMTFSEMRAVYEVANSPSSGSCDVVIGSTHILTPGRFIGQLKDL